MLRMLSSFNLVQPIVSFVFVTWPIVSMGSCFLEVKGLTWNCCDHIITDVCENKFVGEKNRRSGINSELDLHASSTGQYVNQCWAFCH